MAYDVYQDYEVPSKHLERLFAMLGMEPNTSAEDLPDNVRRRYIELRVLADRLGIVFVDTHLWVVLATAGPVEVPKVKPATIPQLWKEKKVSVGQEVFCTLGKQTNLKGTLITVDHDGRSLVQMDNGDERKFTPDKISLEAV